MSHYILTHDVVETDHKAYSNAYAALRDWIESSLEQYKTELMDVLWPLFVHSYLDLVAKNQLTNAQAFFEAHSSDHNEQHQPELVKLKSIQSAQHVAENDLAKSYRTNKYHLLLASYSFELLMNYLQQHKYMTLISLINHYITVTVTEGFPSLRDPTVSERLGGGSLTGDKGSRVSSINKRDIDWPSKGTNTAGVVAGMEEEESPLPDDPDEAARAAKSRTKLPLPGATVGTKDRIASAAEDDNLLTTITAESLPSAVFFTLLNTNLTLNAATASDNGKLIAGAFSDSTVRVWDATRGPRPEPQGPGRGRKNVPHKWNVEQSIPADPLVFHGHSGPVFGVDISPDALGPGTGADGGGNSSAELVLSGSEDGTARLWSMRTKSCLVAYQGHGYPVWDVAWAPTGYYFATASHDRTARLWATEYSYPLRIFAGHLSDVTSLAWHPNCNYLATGSVDKCVRLWDVQSGTCVRIFPGHFGTVYSMAISPDGRVMATAGEDRVICLWDLGSGRKLSTYKGHTDVVWSVAFAKGNTGSNILVSGSADSSVRLWDVAASRAQSDPTSAYTYEALRTYYTKSTPVYDIKFSSRNLILGVGPFEKAEPVVVGSKRPAPQ